jgi:histidinol-phosphate aminotransferase
MSPAQPRPRPGILEIHPYVGGKAELDTARPAIKLSSNESAIGPSPKAIAAYQAEAARLHRYPDGACATLRRAIARRHNLDAERIVCGAGSDELIGLLVRAYAGPGDEVLHSAHGFLMYRLAALAAGAHPVAAPETGLKADVDALLARVSSRTRLVFIANPNNPTGSYLTAAELARLRAGLPEEVLLVVDAAYAELVGAADYASGQELALAHDNVVMCRTFSKLHGLAALRLGWMLGGREVVDVINRVRGPFNVGQPAQAAGVAALEDLEHQAKAKAHNDRWLPWFSERVAAAGFTALPSAGNFVLVRFPMGPSTNADAACAFLNARGIIPRKLGPYDLGDCLRITIGREDEMAIVAEALAAFAEVGAGLKRRAGA